MRDADLFIDLHGEPDATAPSVAHAIGLPLRRITTDDGETFWAWSDGRCRVTFGDHEFEDGDWTYSNYRYHLGVETNDDELRVGLARRLFESLKTLGAPMLLLDNFETQLDEWAPAART